MSEYNMNSILRMLDHVDELSDAEISSLLNDKEALADYETIVLIRQAFHSSSDTVVFSQQHLFSRRMVAAIAILLIVVATLGYAAFRFFGKAAQPDPSYIEVPSTEQIITKDTVIGQELTKAPVIFENETLQTILSQMCIHYDVTVKYEQEDIKDIRLFFNWNPSDSLVEVVNLLNQFDHLNLYINGKTLNVRK